VAIAGIAATDRGNNQRGGINTTDMAHKRPQENQRGIATNTAAGNGGNLRYPNA